MYCMMYYVVDMRLTEQTKERIQVIVNGENPLQPAYNLKY